MFKNQINSKMKYLLTFFRNLIYNTKAIINIIRGDYIHNIFGAYHVLRLWHVQKVKAGQIDQNHPWCTGINPENNQPIWKENIVFRTKPSSAFQYESDEIIIDRVGRFLSSMVKKSAMFPEIPKGKKRRMPHVVNYLHGSVHYNGLWLIFNNFDEAKYFFSDKKFRKEFKHVMKNEKREMTLIFRERNYDPLEYAYFSGFIMSNFPWFANVNGPGKKVMWGNPSPYPAMNIINGSWVKDVDCLRRQQEGFVKSPIDAKKYFTQEYGVIPKPYFFMERFIAYFENEWVRRRGFNGGLFFIDRSKIEPKLYEKYKKDKSIIDDWQFKIPKPFSS